MTGKSTKEIIILAFLFVIALIILFRLDLFELIMERVADADKYEIDEIILAFALLSFFFLAFAVSRWRDQKIISNQLGRERTKLQESNRQLAVKKEELENHLLRSDRMAELITFLQVSRSKDEIFRLFGNSVDSLFPGTGGALYVMRDSRNQLNRVTQWGNADMPAFFSPDDCWALRLGKFFVAGTEPGIPGCSHYEKGNSMNVCIPLSAQGEVLGLFHARFPSEYEHLGSDRSPSLVRQMLMILTDQVSLAISNITLNERLKDLAIHDPLTGLYNRQYLSEILGNELRKSRRNDSKVGILLLDIDHFKAFNDTFGHSAGDAVLKELARYVRDFFRDGDYCCRYGGEEFLVVLTDVDESHFDERLENLRQGISCLDIVYRDLSLGALTASLGVALYPKDGITPDELIDAADKALYEAKTTGRNRVCFA